MFIRNFQSPLPDRVVLKNEGRVICLFHQDTLSQFRK